MTSIKFSQSILVVFCAVSFFLIVIHFPYTPDDTYIYLQYAKNISHGNGISFNSGIPSYGCTSPLWMFIATVGFIFSFDSWLFIKSIDILFIVLSFGIFFRVLRIHCKDFGLIVLGMVFLLFDIWILRWAGSGMETSFSIFLVCCILFFNSQKKALPSFAFSGLLTLVRPEAVILFDLLLFELIYINKKNITQILSSLLVYSAIVIPWMIFSFFYFGSFLPNTFQGKTSSQHSLESFIGSFWESIVILFASQPVMLICILICSILLFKKRIVLNTKSKHLFIWPIVLLIAYAIGNAQVVSRYLLIIIPAMIFGGILMVEQVFEIFHYKKAVKSVVIYTVIGISFLTSQELYWINIYPHTASFQQVTDSCLKPIAQWLSQNSPSNSKVVIPDVGIVGYYSNRILFDPAGLIVPQMRPVFREVGYDEGMTHHLYEKIVIPDYVVDRSSSKERLKSSQLRPIMTTEGVSLGLRNTDQVFYTLYQRIPVK